MSEDLRSLDDRADALINDHDNLLAALIELRTKNQLTQNVVADRMGVSQPTVAAFERYDANPTLATIRRYAMAVGARINTHVIDDTDPAQKSPWQSISEATSELHRLALRDSAATRTWSGTSWWSDPDRQDTSR